jgi:hypothetical protein
VPELATKSFVGLQIEEAATKAGIPRIVWIPSGLDQIEPAQEGAIREIKLTLPGRGFEIIEGSFENLATHLQYRLNSSSNDASRPETGSSEGPQLYLMCDKCDRESARPYRKFLFSCGVDVVWLPETKSATKSAKSKNLKFHKSWLVGADGFLIYYGATDELWLAHQREELKKARGHGRKAAVRARILLDPPVSADKEDLRSIPRLVVDGLPPRPELDKLQALQDFIDELKPPPSSPPGLAREDQEGEALA